MARCQKCAHLLLTLVILFLFSVLTTVLLNQSCSLDSISFSNTNHGRHQAQRKIVIFDENKNAYEFGNESPLIFVGGFPRSGTTLMRAMLESHPLVRCGEETRLLMQILGMREKWRRSNLERKRLAEAGVDDPTIDSAISAFLLEVIANHGRAAPRLCNKDAFSMRFAAYLAQLFPKSKFVWMVRDGRASIHSAITREVTMEGFDLNDVRQCFVKWNQAIMKMYQQCLQVGGNRCKMVHYEQLVLHPEIYLREILKFLDLPWNDTVLHHENHIGSRIALSKLEASTGQIIKPLYTDSLTKWVGKLPKDVVKDMPKIAPMLLHLGYDPTANPPNYGKPDEFVRNKTKQLHLEKKLWDEKVAKLLSTDQPRKEK